MSEVKLNGLYKVTMTEYERGFGQRDMGTKFFDNEAEAKAFELLEADPTGRNYRVEVI